MAPETPVQDQTEPAEQDRHAPNAICFGCGPANPKGLRIKSRWEDDAFVLRFTPREEHQAFPGVLNGGIIGTLFDCHMNWCALTTLLEERGYEKAPCTVTAEFSVKLRRPTPFPAEVTVVARPTKVEGKMVWMEAEMFAEEKKTATASGLFVEVDESHPAHHRWG